MSPRLALLALPLLLAAGCAQQEEPRNTRAIPPAPERFAINVEQADQAMDLAIGRMAAFERLAGREDNAIGYALGRNANPALLPPAGGVAEATGKVLAPAFTALGDYGHVLAQLAANRPAAAKPSPSGTDLAAAAGKALDELRASAGVTLPAAVREAGLRAISTLADLPEQLTKNRGSRLAMNELVHQADPHVKALAAMVQQLIGGTSEQGVRNALRARRLALNETHGRFLNAVRQDRTAGPADRYAIFRTLAELREGDPAQGTLAQVVTLMTALATAHDALDEGAGDADAKVAGFEAAVERLVALGEQSRRAGQ